MAVSGRIDLRESNPVKGLGKLLNIQGLNKLWIKTFGYDEGGRGAGHRREPHFFPDTFFFYAQKVIDWLVRRSKWLLLRSMAEYHISENLFNFQGYEM